MLIKGNFFKSTCFIFAFFRLTLFVHAQDGKGIPSRLMFYNAENLFDTYDDSLKDDNDFLPSGLMRWNQTRYRQKIESLYKTITATGLWEPPAVIALCEVENRKVLEDLIYGTYLSKYPYAIVHEESPDPRGIDVCLIYRKDAAALVNYHYQIPEDFKGSEFVSRSILYAKFVIHKDTIHLIMNHWPSRRGGVLAREDERRRISAMVRSMADSLGRICPSGAKIIIAGDFNCTPDDAEMEHLTTPHDGGINLVNLSKLLGMDGSGTYRYQGTWEMIDQVIVSEKLLKSDKGVFTNEKMIAVFRPDFLLMKDPKYPGVTPFSTYRGYRYQGGFSDHLPVLVDLLVH